MNVKIAVAAVSPSQSSSIMCLLGLIPSQCLALPSLSILSSPNNARLDPAARMNVFAEV